MIRLVGYTDRLSVAAGDRIRFMVNCDHPDYSSQLVRLIHGDTSPAGPGFRQEVVASAVDGRRPGKRESIRTGSSAVIDLPEGLTSQAFTFSVFVQPWLPGEGEQVIASRGTPYHGGRGWALALDVKGRLELVLCDGTMSAQRHQLDLPLSRWTWYFVAVSVSETAATLWCLPVRELPGAPGPQSVTVPVSTPTLSVDAPLVLAAVADADAGWTSRHLDGRLDRPRLIAAARDEAGIGRLAGEPDAGLEGSDIVGAWDFSVGMDTDVVHDASPRRLHGRLVNIPSRAVAGYNFSGQETVFRLAPQEYGAVHFHRDDLEDAGWTADFEFTVPDDLPSGVYAAWLRAGDDEEYLPFVVRPPRGTARGRIAVLMATVTYVTYENFTDLGKGTWRADTDFKASALSHPYADTTIFRDAFAYIDENSIYGPYDVHADGSGYCYGSWLKPILNMRPKFRYRYMSVPSRFPADLYLIDWLDHAGIEVDFITDHDLHAEGASLLEPYSVVISSSHHEYWTTPMMDALNAYLSGGGRLMYLGGNSFYAVTSVDASRPHIVETRRWSAGWPFESSPGERYHSQTGELGGQWRNRGRGPYALLGIGMAGTGFDRGSPYQRMPGSFDPRVKFIFDGIGDDELIGDVPNLQLRWGAAGYEYDRVDYELGSPATTLILASSNRFNQSHTSGSTDQGWFQQGRDGAHVADPQVPGLPHRFARSDMSYLEYPNGGAVFAAGSIAWRASLSAFGYQNSVATVTANVLHRFAETPKGVSPSD